MVVCDLAIACPIKRPWRRSASDSETISCVTPEFSGMSRGCAYTDRNTSWGKKAVKSRSAGVKICKGEAKDLTGSWHLLKRVAKAWLSKRVQRRASKFRVAGWDRARCRAAGCRLRLTILYC